MTQKINDAADLHNDIMSAGENTGLGATLSTMISVFGSRKIYETDSIKK